MDMKSPCRLLLACLCAFFLAAQAVAAAPQKIKLGTLAPRGSLYHQALLQMGEKWRAAAGPGAKFIAYTDGSQGGEADMVRRMRLGQLNAALMTLIGISEIDEATAAIQKIPMLFRSWEEVDYTLTGMHADLERRLMNKGFVVLAWTDGGWVRFFSTKPGVRPEDFKAMKLFSWAGDTAQTKLMKDMGYQPVPLEVTDMLPSVQTGLVNAVPSTPLYALAGQIYQAASYMLDLKWVPILGAIVLTKDSWEAMSPSAQAALKQGATRAAAEISRRSREDEDEAVAAMVKRGLKVTKPGPEVLAQWQREAESAYPRIRDFMVPAESFDSVIRLVNEYRQGAARAAQGR
jgi:TRAP-type transport system periplasmic protein